MATSSVQFYGRETVLQAFTNKGIETWGIFQGKQFITGGEGSVALDEFLKMLEPGGSQATYTLKVYRDIDDPDALTDKVEANGSFNFKLLSAAAGMSLPTNLPATIHGPNQPGGDPIYQRIRGIIDEEVSEAIERRFSGTPERETTGDRIWGFVEDALQEPSKYIPLVQAVIGAFRSPAPAPVVPMADIETAPAKVAGAVSREINGPQLSQDGLERIARAVDRLVAFDADFPAHIEKLADLAEKQPDKYKFALQFL